MTTQALEKTEQVTLVTLPEVGWPAPVGSESLRYVGVAAEFDGSSTFFRPPLRDPRPRAARVQFYGSSAACDHPHGGSETLFEPSRVERPCLLGGPMPDRVVDVREDLERA